MLTRSKSNYWEIDMTDYERFMKYVMPVTETGCWLWTGGLQGNGYGHFNLKKINGIQPKILAHRWSYKYHKGPIEDGLELDHICSIKSCVNPEHLRPVTHKENCIKSNAARKNKNICIRGHKFTPENTYERNDGRRTCRICLRNNRREYRKKLGS